MDRDRGKRTFVDRMGQMAETDGLSPIAGRLFATLLLSAEPRSLDELAEEMGVSKASVSTDARRLFERGIVERITKPGDRRDYYELAADFFAQILRARVQQWRRMRQLVETVRQSVDPLSAVVRDRITSIDEGHTIVIDRADAALTQWERRKRKSSSRGAGSRRRSA